MGRASTLFRMFIICSGLGHIRRGYESFFRGCFDALLADVKDIELYLFKGAGHGRWRERRLWNLPRNSRLARLLFYPFGRGGYFTEQLTFFFSLLPYLLFMRPKVIYVSDVVLANLLRIPQKFCRYNILFNNNGPTRPEFLHRWDHIHQVSPEQFDAAITVGVPIEKQTLLPSAVPIRERLKIIDEQEKVELRRKLDLPVDRMLIISVGAVNTSRKRMDYLIEEVAALSRPRPYLLILGAKEKESEKLILEGYRLLSGGFDARSVEKCRVVDYYQAADVFALASLDEGFGLVYVEALSHGLPCLVHDYPTTRYVLGEMGIYGDFKKAGALTKLITGLTPEDFTIDRAVARHSYAHKQYSWDLLKPAYIEMFKRCADSAEASALLNDE